MSLVHFKLVVIVHLPARHTVPSRVGDCSYPVPVLSRHAPLPVHWLVTWFWVEALDKLYLHHRDVIIIAGSHVACKYKRRKRVVIHK